MVSGGLTNWVDVVKVRMQCDSQNKAVYQRTYPGLVRGAAKIWRLEGPRVLFTSGLLASLLREGSYSTIRMGGYEPVKRFISPNSVTLPLYKKVIAGACSGAFGSFLSTPLDLVKIRLQTDLNRSLPNTFVLLYRIGREEGVVCGLWRGVGPNVARAAITTAAQIPAYDHSKHLMLESGLMREGPLLHFFSSLVAGVSAATANNPVDVVKSRMQAETLQSGVQPSHRNIPQVIGMVLKSEGVQGLYKGWLPNWCRIAPHTCITFLLFEQLRRVTGIRPI